MSFGSCCRAVLVAGSGVSIFSSTPTFSHCWAMISFVCCDCGKTAPDEGRERQARAVLLADAVVADDPAGLVEQLVRGLRIEDQLVGEVDVAGRAGAQHGRRRLVVVGEQRLDDLGGVGRQLQRLAHVEVGEQRVREAQRELRVHAVGLRREDGEALVFEARLVVRLHRADRVALTGGEGADAHAVLGRDDDLDLVEVGAALVLERGGRPVVVLPDGERVLLLRHDIGDREGPVPTKFSSWHCCSYGSSSVSCATMAEPTTDVACRKPGTGAVKWNVTVSSSTTSDDS